MRQRIPGRAGNRGDDCPASAGHPVEERGLADIGPSDEDDDGELAGHGGSSVPRRTTRTGQEQAEIRRSVRSRPAAVTKIDSVSRSIYDGYRFRGVTIRSMIKVDIVNEVSRLAEITKVKAELSVDAVFDAMRISMQRGERIELRGFGVFQVKPRKRGIGRNPRTGREVKIPPGRTIRFKPGKDLQNIG
jgi:DNA-binding protein HU-beta